MKILIALSILLQLTTIYVLLEQRAESTLEVDQGHTLNDF